MRASRFDLDRRLDRAEELLASGLPSGNVEKQLAVEFAVTRRQARTYIQRVYQRREKEQAKDAPFRRENLLRKIEFFFAKCMGKEKFGPAAQALVLEARLSGAFDHAADREALLARLGPPPDEPGAMLLYARRMLMASMCDAMVSPHLDIEKRLRILSDIAFKIAATQSRTEIEAEVQRVEALVAHSHALEPAEEMVDAKAAGWGTSPSSSGEHSGPGALPGSGAAPGTSEDRGDAPSGGGPLGSP